MSRVWKVEMNGNHENSAMGIKMIIPMPASYKRAIERIDFHNPAFFISGFQATAIERIPHPVGKKAKMHAKTSGIDRSVNAIATVKPAIASMKASPWIKRRSS